MLVNQHYIVRVCVEVNQYTVYQWVCHGKKRPQIVPVNVSLTRKTRCNTQCTNKATI